MPSSVLLDAAASSEAGMTIIFDLGRVLVGISVDPFIDTAAQIVGLERDETIRRLHEIERPFETGQIDTAEALARVMEAPGGRWETDRDSPARDRAQRLLAATLASRFVPIPATVEIAHRLADSGFTLALASNTNPLDMDAIRSRYPDILAPFGDRLFLSHELGLMKPDTRFFAAVANGLGVAPGDCVFIDDRPENAEGARSAGMIAIRYTDPSALERSLAPLI
jgi:HAD superfamily hydrolase (TIGR01509 family)